MDVRTTTDLTAEPVSLAVMRNYLEFTATDTAEDTEITAMIKSARQLLERRSGLALGLKTLTVLFKASEVINDSVVLPYSPFVSITTIKLVDIQGTKTTLTLNSDYFKQGLFNMTVYISSMGVGILPGASPTGQDVEVIYVCGYGAGSETLPAVWAQLIKDQVKIWYLRGDGDTSQLSANIANAVDSMTNNVWL